MKCFHLGANKRYYFPDSYDKWDVMDIPVEPPELADYQESLNEPTKTVRVSANWLLDLDQYNEWMNEEDYEVDSSGTPFPIHFVLFDFGTYGSSNADPVVEELIQFDPISYTITLGFACSRQEEGAQAAAVSGGPDDGRRRPWRPQGGAAQAKALAVARPGLGRLAEGVRNAGRNADHRRCRRRQQAQEHAAHPRQKVQVKPS